MTDFATPSSDDDDVVVRLNETHIVQTDVVVTEGYDEDGVPVDLVEVTTLEADVVEVDVMDVDLVETDEATIDAVEARVDDGRVATQGALPLDVRTGDAGVDAAVGQLRALDDLAVTDHPEVFTAVHRALQDALVDLDRS